MRTLQNLIKAALTLIFILCGETFAGSTVDGLFDRAAKLSPPVKFRAKSNATQSECSGSFVSKDRSGGSCRYELLTSKGCVGSTDLRELRLESPFTSIVDAIETRTSEGSDVLVLSFSAECRDVDVFRVSDENPADRGLLCFSQVERTSASRSQVLSTVGNLSGGEGGKFKWNSLRPERPTALYAEDKGAGVFCDKEGEIVLSGFVSQPSAPGGAGVTGGEALSFLASAPKRLAADRFHAVRGPAILSPSGRPTTTH